MSFFSKNLTLLLFKSDDALTSTEKKTQKISTSGSGKKLWTNEQTDE